MTSLPAGADTLQPLGVQPMGLPSVDPPEPPADPTNDILTADLSNWGILKWAFNHFPDAARSRFQRLRTWLFARPRAPTPAVVLGPDDSADSLTLEVSPEMKGVAVSVMIAMPTPRRQRAEGGDQVLEEYLLGTTDLSFR
jgi:hypothetical protein